MKEKFAIQIGFSMILNVLGLVVFFLKSSYLGPDIIGLIAKATSFTGLFTFMLDLGLTSIHYQYTSKEDHDSYFSSFFSLKLVLLLVNYLIPFVFLFIGDYTSIESELIVLNLFSGAFAALSEIFRAQLQAKMKVFKKTTINFGFQMISLAVQTYICFNAENIAEPAQAIIETIFYVNMARFFAYFLMSLRVDIYNKPSWEKIKSYLHDAKPLIFQAVISVINANIGLFIIAEESSYAEIAEYTLIKTYIVTVLIQLSISVSTIFDSVFPKMIAAKKTNQINEIANTFEKYASILFLFIVIVIWLYADHMFELFLPDFLPATKYLKFLIITPYLDGILRPYLGNLVQGKMQKMSATISIINITLGTALQVIFASNLVLGYGVWGLVGIQIFFYIENNLIYRYFSKKYFGIQSSVNHALHIGLSLLCYGIVFGLTRLAFPYFTNDYLFLFFSVCVLGFFFVFIFYLFKEIQLKDVDFIKGLFQPSKYLKSFKEEMGKD